MELWWGSNELIVHRKHLEPIPASSKCWINVRYQWSCSGLILLPAPLLRDLGCLTSIQDKILTKIKSSLRTRDTPLEASCSCRVSSGAEHPWSAESRAVAVGIQREVWDPQQNAYFILHFTTLLLVSTSCTSGCHLGRWHFPSVLHYSALKSEE